jgi:hypothetical protein
MIKQNEMKNWKWTYDYNQGTITHPCNTSGWKEFYILKLKLEEFTQKKYKLIRCPIIYVDEYEQQKNRKKKVYGIYLILANLPIDQLQNKNISKF